MLYILKEEGDILDSRSLFETTVGSSEEGFIYHNRLR